MSRSLNSMNNIVAGFINKILLMAMAFSVRTLFIKYLGAEYNGLNSLFTNLLSILSLAELGIGNVLMFSLYSALKDKNEDEIVCLTYEFKKIYRIVIALILCFGTLIMLFLPLIVKSEIDIKMVFVYYFLSLVNSVTTYFIIYRTMVMRADQKNYIISNCTTVTTIVMYCFQIISLITFKSFLAYLLIQMIFNIVNNVILNQIALKKYPYLKKKIENYNYEFDKKKLFGDIKATFIYKISDTILDQTDSIIISIMFGTLYVGYYSNYYIIITYLVNIAAIIANGLVASFGNLNAENNMRKSYQMFKASMFAFCCYGVVCTVCYCCSVQDFINLWIGKDFIMQYDFIFALVAVFYLRMVTNTMWMYRTSMGLFKEVQYMSILSAVLNIILSVALGFAFGIAGVVISTAIARLLSTFWYEGKILYKKFNEKLHSYLLRQLKDFLILTISLVSSFLICSFINKFTNSYILLFLLKNIICVLISSVILFLTYFKTEEFSIIKNRLINLFLKKGISK